MSVKISLSSSTSTEVRFLSNGNSTGSGECPMHTCYQINLTSQHLLIVIVLVSLLNSTYVYDMSNCTQVTVNLIYNTYVSNSIYLTW